MKKFKSTFQLLWIQEKEYHVAWILAIVFIVVMIVYQMHISEEIENLLHSVCSIFVKFLHSSGECIYTIAVSYIAGWIFYILTVAVPKARQAKQKLHIIAEAIRYLNDEFYILSCEMTGENWLEKDLEASVVEYIKNCSGNDSMQLLSNCNKLKEFQMYYDTKMIEIFADVSSLTNNELQSVVEMKLSPIMFRIRGTTIPEPIISDDKIKKIANGIIELNHKSKELYESISTRLYKDSCK